MTLLRFTLPVKCLRGSPLAAGLLLLLIFLPFFSVCALAENGIKSNSWLKPQPFITEVPRGIFALDSRWGTPYGQGGLRETNWAQVKDLDFVAGYAWRQNWALFEPEKGKYDFYPIDFIMTKMQESNKQLGFLLIMTEPEYIAESAQATWRLQHRSTDMLKPVPWDRNAINRYKHFIRALSEHKVDGLRFSEHPGLSYLTVGIPGLGALRQRNLRIADMNGYSREVFIAAVIESLTVVVEQFPGKTISIGFWKINDDYKGYPLWEELRTRIIMDLDGKVGFFMENLAASGDAFGNITGYPNTNFAATLYRSRDEVPIYFQALTAWKSPFTGLTKVQGAGPLDGIRYAQETYNAQFFELYLPDLLDKKYSKGLKAWHDELIKLNND